MTDHQRPKLTNAEWKTLSDEVAAQLEQLFVGSDEYLGKSGLRVARSALKSVSVKSSTKIQQIAALLTLADLAGRGDLLLAGAEVLRSVPFTGNITNYEPVRETFCAATRRTILNGDSGEPFLSLIRLPALDSPPEELELRRTLIRQRANGSLLTPPSESDAAQATTPSAHHVVGICMAVSELCLMWAFGGGDNWTRSRIDDEIDTAAQILRNLQAIR